jgi:hypothetical protein
MGQQFKSCATFGPVFIKNLALKKCVCQMAQEPTLAEALYMQPILKIIQSANGMVLRIINTKYLYYN